MIVLGTVSIWRTLYHDSATDCWRHVLRHVWYDCQCGDVKPSFVNLNSTRNLFILGFAFFMGLSMPEYIGANPVNVGVEWVSNIINTLGSTGMAVGAFIALV